MSVAAHAARAEMQAPPGGGANGVYIHFARSITFKHVGKGNMLPGCLLIELFALLVIYVEACSCFRLCQMLSQIDSWGPMQMWC